MNISLESKLTLYPLVIREDKKRYIVEETVSGEFFEMPVICIDAIYSIIKNKPLTEIEKELQKKYPNEEVDMVDFAHQLMELGLIKEIDHEEVNVKKKSQLPTGFTWIPTRIAQIFFNKLSTRIYLIVICFNFLLLLMNPKLLPHYQDLFLFDAMIFNVLIFMGISLCLIIIHEYAHILAIRAHGLPATLEIGHRLFLIVFETDLTPAWKLKSKQRNGLYLAGIFFDQCMILIALVVTLLFPQANSTFLGILGIVIFDLFIKAIYQCCFYMKTDLYYLFENITGCYNVMENSKKMLSNWLPFLSVNASMETFEKEEWIIRLYGLFYVSGIILTTGLFIIYFIPQAFYAYSITLSGLKYPVSHPLFWDAIVYIGLSFLMGGLLIYSWIKKRRTKRLSTWT